MPGTLDPNPLSVQWKIHFPVQYEIRRLWDVSRCTHGSNSLEVTFLFSNIRENKLKTHAAGHLQSGKWTVVMMGTSESGRRAKKYRASRSLHNPSRHYHQQHRTGIIPLLPVKIWGLRLLETWLEPYDLFPFSRKSFIFEQIIEEERIEDSISKSGSLAAQGGTLITGFNIALIKNRVL